MFALYTEEKRIFGFEDYGALVDECKRISARTVLEFGPGMSTFALIEAGCQRIATCEYQEKWLNEAVERFKPYSHVSVHRYANHVDVEVEGLSRMSFDLAFVDSPLGQPSRNHVKLPAQEECNRLNTVLYALDCAPVVLLHDAKREGEGYTLARVAALGHRISMINTTKGIARIERRTVKEVKAL